MLITKVFFFTLKKEKSITTESWQWSVQINEIGFPRYLLIGASNLHVLDGHGVFTDQLFFRTVLAPIKNLFKVPKTSQQNLQT